MKTYLPNKRSNAWSFLLFFIVILFLGLLLIPLRNQLDWRNPFLLSIPLVIAFLSIFTFKKSKLELDRNILRKRGLFNSWSINTLDIKEVLPGNTMSKRGYIGYGFSFRLKNGIV